MSIRVKICGLRDPETAIQAAHFGADALGLVFYKPSPRHLSIEQARSIALAIPPFITRVGLFVDAPSDYVQAVLKGVPLDLLQFHGNETPEYCSSFNTPYIKAVRVRPGLDLVKYCQIYCQARGLLCDAYVEGTPGGTGAGFDWSLIPDNLPLPLILSGGLDPENVATAVSKVRPWAVDVSSGVEKSKGVKDLAKIEAFIAGAKNAPK